MGEGELARTLARASHSVTAIDLKPPKVPSSGERESRSSQIPAQFDHVVAILSLHHVEDLGMA